ncbi:PAS domain-containing sensor histidine kinase [Desulfobacca acetoxidans]|uniref:histidine kinase n=1 Tax=Desulfobacca acetoxidans (strain ATCC 700848 / DSM 11109 / ASRB2) TaxID=880072 RepID=F2NI08_DESAR|nr:PAS domain S-box protein [Desulfobacca acetoxidans]AEB09634.1 PAS/PAC sensor signal transduction histidine kinase [Desulfobacca acetoxidans DSM 11109]
MEAEVFPINHGLELQRYQTLYEMLLEAIPSSVLLINQDLRIVSVNRNFLEKNRRTISDTIGHRLDEVFPAIIIDQMDFPGRIRQVFEQNFRVKGERMTYRAPGIPLRIYYYSILPFSWQGVVELAMLLMEDVTEQVRLSEEVRRVERHLALVVESAQDIVLSTDMEGRILTWNTAAERLSGFTLYQVRGRNFFDFCVCDDPAEIRNVFSNLQAGQEAQMSEWDLKTNHGGRIPVAWIFSPMRDLISKTAGVVAVGRDLTERRQLEAQLLQSQKLAALGVMAGGIAHEIRNPLAVCSSAAQFIMQGDVTPEFRQQCAEKIHRGIQRASMIIENLLRFARPSMKTDLKKINLTYLLSETLSLVTNQARIQKIELRAQLPEYAIIINGMEGLLQQAFMNLLLNAIRAVPDGGVIDITLKKIGAEAWIAIKDTGHGIEPSDLNNIFDPFYTTAPVGQGSGLGLSICYSIIKQHFGAITVDSQKGEGSTFVVKLPIL